MNYKRPGSYNYASVVRKALKSFYNKQETTPVESAGDQKDKRKTGKSDIKKTDIVMAISTVVLTVGTLALFFEAFQQTREVKEEFKIANTPYLQLSNVLDSVHPGQHPIISYSIENLGKVPCKILWAEIADSISSQPPVPINPFQMGNSFSSAANNRIPVNMYAIEGSPYYGQFTASYSLNQQVYDELKKRGAFHYFYGIIGYVNQMSNEERIYEFSAQLLQSPLGAREMLTNENWFVHDYEVKHRVFINE